MSTTSGLSKDDVRIDEFEGRPTGSPLFLALTSGMFLFPLRHHPGDSERPIPQRFSTYQVVSRIRLIQGLHTSSTVFDTCLSQECLQ